MKNIFLYVFILMPFSLSAQIICGEVRDAETNVPIINANVYLNGTYTGTMTDTLGVFKLDCKGRLKHILVVSSVGYYSESIHQYDSLNFIRVSLNPKVIELAEVQVVFNKTEMEKLRKKALKRFQQEFLGNTYNARKCEIENLDDLLFRVVEDKKIFEAYTEKPLKIYNGAMGYTITYHLENFSLNNDTLAYEGYHFFVEDTSRSKWKTKRMIKRREWTYRGSRMHFFRTLFTGEIKEEGFVLRDSLNNIVEPGPILSEIHENSRNMISRGSFMLYFFPDMKNIYTFKISSLHIDSDSVHFTRDGYFDPRVIIWSGEAAKHRVGDLLPFEYKVQ